MSDINTVVNLDRLHKEEAASILAKAFEVDPLFINTIRDNTKRKKELFWLMKRIVDYSLLYGRAYATSTRDGCICWLPPGQTKLTLRRIFRTGLQAIVYEFGITAYKRFHDNLSYTDKLHEKYASYPHWYLWAIGVKPTSQGNGTGGKLMQPILSIADDIQMPCYLETHNELNVRFYRKHGFRIVKEGRVPKHNLNVWAMLREPSIKT